jgi:hypothetical protein
MLRGATGTISNNIVHDSTSSEGNGIDLDGYAGAPIIGSVVSGNTIYNILNSSISAIALENAYSTLVYNNLVHDAISGINVINYQASPFGDQRSVPNNSIIHHNIIYNVTNGLNDWDAGYVTWENNTVYDSDGQYGFANYSTVTTYAHHLTFTNNIIAGTWLRPMYSAVAGFTIWSQLDYNDIMPNGTEIYREPGVPRTLAYLQSQGLMTHGIISNPLFSNASGGDFRLLGTSPATNAGIDVGLTQDFLGRHVPACGIPDIGAHESCFGRIR